MVPPGMGTRHRWQPRPQRSVPDLAAEQVAKLGLVSTPGKVEKLLPNFSKPKSDMEMTCAARAEPQRASRRSPMLTTPSLPPD